MNVVFDAERLRNPASGLGQLCRALGAALLAERPAGATVTFSSPARRSGPSAMLRGTWRRAGGTATVRPTSADVWHATHQDVWIRPPRRVPTVLTIMDLNFLERPDYSARRKSLRLAAVQRLVDRAAVVSAISAYSASVIEAHLKLRGRTVHVVHLGNPLEGTSPAAPTPDDARLAPLAGERFFLVDGRRAPQEERAHPAADAAAVPGVAARPRGPDNHPYAREVAAQAAALGVADRVMITGAVSDADRRWLYERCERPAVPLAVRGIRAPGGRGDERRQARLCVAAHQPS